MFDQDNCTTQLEGNSLHLMCLIDRSRDHFVLVLDIVQIWYWIQCHSVLNEFDIVVGI